MVAGTGTSAPDTVVDYTYGLKINKVDLGTEKALQGAKFTIAAGDTTNGDENSANVKYVKSDGTLSDSKVELSMDPNGVLTLTGLDAGVYTVTEIFCSRWLHRRRTLHLRDQADHERH